MTAPGAPADRVSAGTVGKAHGLDGSFYVAAAVPALLERGASLWLDGEDGPRTVERRAGTDERPLLRLSGSASRNDAEALRGRTLLAPLEAAGELDDDEFWAHDLVGCVVLAREDDRELGQVAELMALPSCEALVVRSGEGGRELLVPMVKDAIVSVDAPARRIVVDATFLALDEA